MKRLLTILLLSLSLAGWGQLTGITGIEGIRGIGVYGEDSTWVEKMVASYVAINSHSTFTQAQLDSISYRLSTVESIFGEAGLNKTVCDFFLFFQNSNTSTALTTRTITKTGETLRWDYGNGNIYSQNDLPNKVNNGVITVTSGDGFFNITNFYCNANTFTGTLPSFSACTNLTNFNCNTNTFTGTLPLFSVCTKLTNFYCNANTFTGTLPSFSVCTNLTNFYCNANTFTGTLPSFSACTKLTTFYCYTNTFTGETTNFCGNKNINIQFQANDFTLNGINSFAKAMTILNLQTNNYTTTEVDELLTNMDTWYTGVNLMTANATITLNGTGMAAPTNGSSNANITSLLLKATGAGKTWVFLVNEP